MIIGPADMVCGTYVLSCGSASLLQIFHSDLFSGRNFFHSKLGIKTHSSRQMNETQRPQAVQLSQEFLLLVAVQGRFADLFCVCTWVAKIQDMPPSAVMSWIGDGRRLADLEHINGIYPMPHYQPGSTADRPFPPNPIYRRILDIYWKPSLALSAMEIQ